MWTLWMFKCVPCVHVVVASRLSMVVDGTKIVKSGRPLLVLSASANRFSSSLV